MRRPSIRRRLGETLVSAGVLTPEQLEDALAVQATAGRSDRLGTTVVSMGLASEENVAEGLATQVGVDQVNLAFTTPEPDAVSRIPRRLAHRHLAVPIALDEDELTVAVADPTDVLVKDALRAVAGVDTVQMVVATETSIRAALRSAYGTDQSAIEALGHDVEIEEQPEDDPEDLYGAVSADAPPIVRLTNLIMAEAVSSGASDVHVEPGRHNVRVRYRIDGMLREVMRVPRESSAALTSRLKIMARLDIAERRQPQDGRTLVRVEGQEVDLRVSSLPTMYGEKIVMRLLRKGVEQYTIDEIGLSPSQMSQLRVALDRPQGLIIITGPTGSGKTTTLYAALNEINDSVRNMVTLEDPVEYQLEGINQTQINAKAGLTFARGLRSLLRQDPDVVLVGEVRDHETAQLAMEASFTGHLVLTTLHTNNAPSSMLRLLDLGIEPFHVASSLLLVVSQRLVRMTCRQCAEPYEPDERILTRLGLTPADVAGVEFQRGAGCELCGGTGFIGRQAIFEMLTVTPAVRELLMDGATEMEITRLACEEGMRTLREDGLRTAFEGKTTLEEVLRVTPSETLEKLSCLDCGEQLAEGFVACPRCGSTVGVEACGGCGRHLESGWLHCPYCRTPVSHGDDGAPGARGKGIESNNGHHGHGTASRNGRGTSDVNGNGDGNGGGRKLILVADDDEAFRRVASSALVEDCDVIQAATGEQTVDMAVRHRPDAIILNLGMPDQSGVEVAEALRADEATRWIPIVMTARGASPDTEVEDLVAGLADHVRQNGAADGRSRSNESDGSA